MQNPIQNEDDLVVFVHLMMENMAATIESHKPEEMAYYLDQWNHITQYAHAHADTQSAAFVADFTPMINTAIEGIAHLYELVTGEKYVAPQDRQSTTDNFSISNFLKRVSAQRENQASYNPWAPKKN